MSNTKQILGRWGEDRAAEHLRKAGYRIIAGNFRCQAGEMDIICQAPDGSWVFVEVKTRRSNRYGRPEEAITPAKAKRLIQIAEAYLQASELDDVDWRIDVIAIETDSSGRLNRLEQIENAVSGW